EANRESAMESRRGSNSPSRCSSLCSTEFQTRETLEYLKNSLNTCEQNGESVVAKLKVVHQHKVKIDELYRRTVNDSRKNVDGLKENLRRCELNHLSVKERLTACEQAAANTVSHDGNTVDGKERERRREEQAERGDKYHLPLEETLRD
ncbi:hypothetical protein PENTCL1PPCAC_6871, partial [Pristionchus entomophagus]